MIQLRISSSGLNLMVSMIELGPELEDGDIQMVPYSPNEDRKKFWNQEGLTLQTDIAFGAKDFYISFQNADLERTNA